MEFVFFIGGVLSLIAVIVFFVVADSIAVIKATLKKDTRRPHARVEYLKHLSAGNIKEAHEALLYLFFHDLGLVDGEKRRRKEYDQLKLTYEPHFKRLGFEYPKYLD